MTRFQGKRLASFVDLLELINTLLWSMCVCTRVCAYMFVCCESRMWWLRLPNSPICNWRRIMALTNLTVMLSFSVSHKGNTFYFTLLFKLFYCCSITVVCIFSPPFPPNPGKPTSLPCSYPPLWFCPCVLYSSSWQPFSPLSPPPSPLAMLDCS